MKKKEEIQGRKEKMCLLGLDNKFEMEDHTYYLARIKQGIVNASSWKYTTGT